MKVACKFLLCSLRTESSQPHQTSGHTASNDTRRVAVESLNPSPGSSMEKYLPIIKSVNISIEDRIGFACTYLSDSEVDEYLYALVTDCKAAGDFEGLVITGNIYFMIFPSLFMSSWIYVLFSMLNKCL